MACHKTYRCIQVVRLAKPGFAFTWQERSLKEGIYRYVTRS